MNIPPLLAVSYAIQGAAVGIVAVICCIIFIVLMAGFFNTIRHAGKACMAVFFIVLAVFVGTLSGGVAIVVAAALLLIGYIGISIVRFLMRLIFGSSEPERISSQRQHRNYTSSYGKPSPVSTTYAFDSEFDELIILASRGHATSQYKLGVMFHEGRTLSRDDAEAWRWFKSAADQGHRGAQYNLGIMRARGLGVSKNIAEAYARFSVAARLGDRGAVLMRNKMRDRLDSSEVRWARGRVEEILEALPKQQESSEGIKTQTSRLR